MKIAHLDLETRSLADLPEVGAFRYACDPSTEILMAAVARDEPDSPVFLWVNPKYETPDMMSDDEALTILREADEVYTHSLFEAALIWGRTTDMGVPIHPSKWRDTAAMARKAGLPSSLERCAESLDLPIKKDKEGKRLIKLFSEPQEDGSFVDPRSRPAEWRRFGDYNITDTVVGRSIKHKLSAFTLSGSVLESFLFDIRMNMRGIPINLTAAANAQRIIEVVGAGVSEKFRALTQLNPTQREKVRVMVDLPNMQADTVEAALKDPKTTPERRVILDLYSKLSYAAVKKVAVMLKTACPDNRVRGGHLWYGTVPGRHSGRQIQPQNFKKTPPWMRPITGKVYQAIWDGKDADWLDLLYGDPQELIAGCIRHFIHLPGSEMLDGDYSAIQARVIAWLARDPVGLKMWSDYDKGLGPSPYRVMASKIYGIPEPKVTEDQREVGKRVILGAGFQMGPPKFQSSCMEQYGLSLPLDLCELGISTFRRELECIPKFWYFLQRSAREAIQFPGSKFGPFIVKDLAGMKYLLMTLPSGRSIAYPRPEVNKRPPTEKEKAEMKKGKQYPEDRFMEITYWGNTEGDNWGRVKLYGGKLAENMTMGVEADYMNHGLIEAEKRGFQPFMLVHDQALSLRTSKTQTAEQYAAALAALPPWAAGLPVKVEAKVVPYYAK